MANYSKLIRETIPDYLNLALKWCGVKTKWIDLVYDNIVKKYPSNKRAEIIDIVLGKKAMISLEELKTYFQVKNKKLVKIPPEYMFYMAFRETIPWDKLKEQEIYEWNVICSWVIWFKYNFEILIFEKNKILELKKDNKNTNRDYIIDHLCKTYLKDVDDEIKLKLAEYIYDNITKIEKRTK